MNPTHDTDERIDLPLRGVPTHDTPWLVDFAAATRLDQVGGKALGLHRLTRLGMPVPPGFVVTTAAFRDTLADVPELNAALAALRGLRAADTEQLRIAAARVREVVVQIPLPPALAEQTQGRWRTITGGARVAVRSSATAEDLAEASFAGQQDTYLDVTGDDLLARLRACWASLWSDRAVAYRLRQGLGAADVAMAVVVQRMLAPSSAGVLFTADPLTGRRDTLVLEAVAGLGEVLVSGQVTPQVHRIRASDLASLDVAVPVGEPRLLTDAAARELAGLGLRAQAASGEPLDLEWAIADDTAWLLQARAITTLPPIPKPAPTDGHQRIYISFGHVQVNTAPISPLALSSLALLIPFDRDPATDRSRLVVTAGARMYIDVTPLLAQPPFDRLMPRTISRMSRQIGERLASLATRPELREQAPRVRAGLLPIIRKVGPVLTRAALTVLRGPTSARDRLISQLERWLAAVRRDYSDASGPAARLLGLRNHLVHTLDHLLLAIALPVLLPGMLAELRLRALTREHAPDEPDDALLRGLTGNSTTEMDLELGDLADLARELPPVAAALLTDDPVAAIAAARARPDVAAFYTAWDAFLARHGQRAAGELDIALPRWSEDPGVLLRTLAGALPRAPKAHRRQHDAAREHADRVLTRVLHGVSRGPLGWLRARRTRRLVHRARTLLALREHHKAALVVLLDLLRRAALELAPRLVERGEIPTPDDLWLLTLDELIAAARRLDHNLSPSPHLELTARRDELRRYADWSPPAVLTSLGEAVPAPPQRDLPPNTLVGTGVSSGVYEGVVRVVRDPTRETLAAGEVLVAAFTDPGWTPLFMHAGAVVIEVGGALTHGSVIARELGIPAVVAVDGVTRLLRTGQRVRVDGERGWVQPIAGDDP